MPRVYFTGRKKISKKNVSVIFRHGRPPVFSATVDLARSRRSLPAEAIVVVEAYHNTMLQRFDFGTVADCRPREDLRLTQFDENDRPRFRLRVIDIDSDPGAVLASCERIDAVDQESESEGGRSMLTLLAKSDSEMRGELWRLAEIGGGYQVWYNKDTPSIATEIKSKRPAVLGLIIPAVLRDIYSRELLWGGDTTSDLSEWIRFRQSISGDIVPAQGTDGDSPSDDDIETWIDSVVAAFCQNRAKFVERILEAEGGI